MTITEERPAPVKTSSGQSAGVRSAFSGRLASVIVVVITLLWTLPTFVLLVRSFRPKEAAQTTGWWTVFSDTIGHLFNSATALPAFTFDNYQQIFFSSNFGSSSGLTPYLFNSLIITIPATIFPIMFASMAAYALAWIPFRGNNFVFFSIFALQIVPLQMSLIPLLLTFKAIGINNSYAAVWAAHTMFALPLAIFLLHNFIAALPRDLIEAARVDGASHFVIFRRIVLPLSTPALASFAIFQFLWVWNDLLVAITFSPKTSEVMPITGRLAQLSGSLGNNLAVLTAGAFIAIVVPLIVFFSLQRYFVRGLLAGSVKG